ncbi:MAG: hypothetical protein V7720_12625 [Halioglobus sp.]
MVDFSHRLLKSLLRASFALLLLILLLVIGIFSWLKYDNNNLKLALETGLSEWLQRELVIGELLDVRLGTDSFLVAKNVQLANPFWADKPYFVSAGRLVLDINLPSLWQEGPILLNHIELENTELNLQANADQQATWLFWPDSSSEPTNADTPFPVIITSGELMMASVGYQDPDQNIEIDLQQLHIDQQAGDDMIGLKLDGAVNGRPLTARGRAGPARALFSGHDLKMDLAMSIDKLELEAVGEVADFTNLKGLALQVRASSPRSRHLLDLLGMHEVQDGPLQFAANLQPGDPGLNIDAVGKLGEFDLEIKGSIDRPLEIDGIDANFTVDGPSLMESGAMLEVPGLPDVPYLLSGLVKRNGTSFELINGELIAGNSELRISGRLPTFPKIDDWQVRIDGSGINLALLGPALGLEGIKDTAYHLSGQLQPSENGVELIDVTLHSNGSQLSLNGVVGDGPSYHNSHLKVELAGENISDMGPWLGLEKMPSQKFTLSAQTRFDADGWTLSDGRLLSADLQLGLDASVDSLINTSRIEGDIHLATNDPIATLRAYGVDSDLELALPLSFSGKISGTPESAQLTDGSITLGQHTGSIAGNLGDFQDLDKYALALALSGPDILQLYPIEQTVFQQPLQYDAAANLNFDGSALNLSNLTLQFPGQQLSIRGELKANTSAPFQLIGKIHAEGQSLHRFQSMFSDNPLLMDIPFQFTASLEATADEVQIAPFTILAGQSDLGGSLGILLKRRPKVQATLRSEKIYLPLLVPSLEQLQQDPPSIEEDEEFDIQGYTAELTKNELRERLIPNTTLNMDLLRQFDGELTYAIDKMFLAEEDAATALQIGLALDNGVLKSDRFEWDGTFSKGNASTTIDVSGDTYKTKLLLEGERIPFLWLLAGEPDNDGDSLYKARLEGQGNTPRQLAASLNGAMLFRDEGGRLDNYDMGLLLGDLLGEIIDRLNPTTESSQHSEIACTAGAVIVHDGLVEVVPGLIMRSDKLDFVSAGSINLNTEIVDLAFSTRSRKGLGLSAGRTLTNYIKLGGTLTNPRLALDAKGAVVSSTAAIATAGLSILAESMWDRWVLTTGDPCKRLIKQAREDKKRNYESLWLPTGNPS